MAGRSQFDEHEQYVTNRAAMEIAEKLGISLDNSLTPQQMILKDMHRQLGEMRQLTGLQV